MSNNVPSIINYSSVFAPEIWRKINPTAPHNPYLLFKEMPYLISRGYRVYQDKKNRLSHTKTVSERSQEEVISILILSCPDM